MVLGHGRLVHITDDPTTCTGTNRSFDLFDPKPTLGPTPLVNAIDIHVRDLPSRILAGLLYPEALQDWNYPALASVTGSGRSGNRSGSFRSPR